MREFAFKTDLSEAPLIPGHVRVLPRLLRIDDERDDSLPPEVSA